MQIPNWLDAEHCVPICSGNVFALDIAFYRTRLWRQSDAARNLREAWVGAKGINSQINPKEVS